MANKMKFQVKSSHHVMNGKRWYKNEVLESNRQLDKIFPNKFQRVHDSEVPDEGTPLKPEESEDDGLTGYVPPEGKLPLADKSHKGELPPAVDRPEKKNRETEETLPEDEAEQGEAKDPTPVDLGQDVTKEFSDAVEAKVSVRLLDGAGYVVYDAEGKKVNDGALAAKKDVKKFLATLL